MSSPGAARVEMTKRVLAVSDLQIGETAGRVWQRLANEGPQHVSALMDEIQVPESVFYMGVGWLAREDKLEFEADDGDYLVRLK